MKFKSSLKYSIFESLRAVVVFYIVIAILIALTLFLSLNGLINGNGNSSSTINGMEFSTAIFIFVLGLNSFKERLLMMMQNGVSRKTIFLSSMTSFVILCFFMSVFDRVVSLLAKLVIGSSDQLSYSGLFEMLYHNKNVGMSAAAVNLEGFLLSLGLYLACATIGFFITISYYRMNKSMKVIISVGVPVGLTVVLPVVDRIANGKISQAIIRVLNFAMGLNPQRPFHAMVTFLLIFAAFSGLSWLLVRKIMVHSS